MLRWQTVTMATLPHSNICLTNRTLLGLFCVGFHLLLTCPFPKPILSFVKSCETGIKLKKTGFILNRVLCCVMRQMWKCTSRQGFALCSGISNKDLFFFTTRQGGKGVFEGYYILSILHQVVQQPCPGYTGQRPHIHTHTSEVLHLSVCYRGWMLFRWNLGNTELSGFDLFGAWLGSNPSCSFYQSAGR